MRLRPQIAEFAALMEREMQANAHKDDHPLSRDFDHLLDQLDEHVAKFRSAPTPEHAADVANLAMLALAERQRAWKPGSGFASTFVETPASAWREHVERRDG